MNTSIIRRLAAAVASIFMTYALFSIVVSFAEPTTPVASVELAQAKIAPTR